MSKYSEAPWSYELSDSMEDGEDAFLILSEDGDVAEITSSQATAEADASLIAAAPDLLAACKMVQRTLELCRDKTASPLAKAADKSRAEQMLRDAIAKAEGTP